MLFTEISSQVRVLVADERILVFFSLSALD